MFEGDSLTECSGAFWGSIEAARLLADDNYNSYANVATGGEKLVSDMIAQGATQVDPLYNSAYQNNIAVIWAGTNDVFADSLTGAQILAGLETWCLARRAVGWKTVVCTMHPVVDGSGNYDTARGIVNAALLAAPTWCDAVCDSGSDPALDPYDDDIYNQEDHLHLTEFATVSIIAPYLAASIGALSA